jgi:hypothetical protein
VTVAGDEAEEERAKLTMEEGPRPAIERGTSASAPLALLTSRVRSSVGAVLAIRLYSGPAFQPINEFLRAISTLSCQRIRQSVATNSSLTFAATTRQIICGLRKLSAVADPEHLDMPLYRAVSSLTPRGTPPSPADVAPADVAPADVAPADVAGARPALGQVPRARRVWRAPRDRDGISLHHAQHPDRHALHGQRRPIERALEAHPLIRDHRRLPLRRRHLDALAVLGRGRGGLSPRPSLFSSHPPSHPASHPASHPPPALPSRLRCSSRRARC